MYVLSDAETACFDHVVYALSDPRTQEVRYIGKTATRLEGRLDTHFQPSSLKTNTKKDQWLRGMLKAGIAVEVDVLERCSGEEELNQAERFHIASWRFMGARLTNHTDGGDGAIGLKWSTASRAQASLTHKERIRPPRSEQARVSISRGKGGRPVFDDQGVRYETLAEAARALGVRLQDVSAAAHGRIHGTGGRRLRFEGADFSAVRKWKRFVEDERGVRHASLTEAAKALGLSIAAASLVANGKRKHAKGHVLRFVD